MPGLTALKVKAAKPGRHGDGAGLYLLVSSSGARSWMIRVQADGRRRDIGLGSTADLTLEEARDKGRELRKVARAGGDPIAARDKRDVAPPSFRVAAEACHEALKAGWADRHGDAFLATLKLHAFPRIGSLRVDSVDENDLAAVLLPIWHAKPAAAKKIRQRLGAVLDYAKAKQWRSFPAPRESLSKLLSKQADPGNFAAMPYELVPDFVGELNGGAETMGRLAVLFTILTAARGGETRSAMWSHIDFEAKEWNRPADLMKGKRAHSVTLSSDALAILKRAERLRTTLADCLVFPGKGGRELSDMTMGKLARPKGVTVHGFRSSFRTWAAERMPSVPEAVAETALAHTIPDAVVRAYNRARFMEARRALLDAWGRYVTGVSGDVVQLPLLRDA